MSISLTQETTAHASASSLTKAFTANVTAGNLLVIVGSDAAGTSAAALGVSDSEGNTYTQASLAFATSIGQTAIWYAVAKSSGSCSVTITSNAASPNLFGYYHEFSSPTGWPASPFDVAAVATGNSLTASSGNLTTTTDGELVFGFFPNGIKTAGSGFTLLTDASAVEYQTQTTAGAIAATGTQYVSGAWQAFGVAFKTGSTSTSPYAHYRTLTIDHSQLSAAQTNFPVLVKLTDATLKSAANGGHVQNASGYDIVLTADMAATEFLNWDVEQYDPAGGVLVLWVQVPSLSSTADTVLYLQYGNAAISTSQTTAASTWDSNFAAVWHLSKAANLGADSTANANNGTNHGATSNADASIGAACASFDATSSQYIGVPNASSLNPTSAVTLSGWVNPDDQVTSWSNAFGKLPVGGAASSYGFWLNSNSTYFWADINEKSTETAAPLTTNVWSHIVMTYDGTTISLYVDGILSSSTPYSGAINANSNQFAIGANTNASIAFDGSLAEIQLSSVARSAAWVAAAYANQKPGSTLLAMGTEHTHYAQAFADTFTILEILGRQTGRHFGDAAALADAIARAMNRRLFESVSATESFHKAPVKVVKDTKLVTDAITRQPGKTVVESLGWSERIAKATSRAVAETWALAESLLRQSTKTVAETWALAESLLRQSTKTAAEGFTLAETLSKQAAHVLYEFLNDAFTLADAIVRHPAKAFSDGVALSERIAKATARQVVEALPLAEALARQAARAFAEALTLAEQLARTTARAFSEALTLADVFAFLINGGLGAVRRYAAEIWQRLWAAETPTRNWSATEIMIYADPKNSEAVENFEIDWTATIGSDFITASSWEIPADFATAEQTNTGSTATVRLGGGVAGTRYLVKNVVTLQSGQVKVQALLIPVV